MGAMTSQIISLTIVCSTVYSGADQRKHQSSASLAFVWGIHRGPVNSPHKWPVTRKMFPFDDVIMSSPHGDNTLSHDISPLTLTSVIMPDAKVNPWWRHQMEAFPALLESPVTGEFPSQRPVTRNFDVFFDLHLNKWSSKQSCGWYFETPSHSLWRHGKPRGQSNFNKTHWHPGLKLCLRPANERRRNFVMASFIAWVQA